MTTVLGDFFASLQFLWRLIIQSNSRWGHLTAFFVGCLGATVFAPLHWFFFLFLSVSFLIWRLDFFVKERLSKRYIFFYSFFFSFGYFLFGLYWVGISFFKVEPIFIYIMPLMVGALCGLLSLLFGCMFLFTFIFLSLYRNTFLYQLYRFFWLPFFWTSFEWIRGHVFFGGFPWNLIGYSFGFTTSAMQLDAIVGPYGLSFLAVFLGGMVAFFQKGTDKLSIKDILKGCFLAVMLVLFILGFGYVRMQHKDYVSFKKTFVRIVQPNVSEQERWNINDRDKNFDRLMRMSIQSNANADANLVDLRNKSTTPMLIVWPESSLPFPAFNTPQYHRFLTNLFLHLPAHSALAAGVVRFSESGKKNTRVKDAKTKNTKEKNIKLKNSLFGFKNISFTIKNSILFLYKDNHTLEEKFYDKINLVPFGEYIPLASFLKKIGLSTIANARGSFSRGHYRSVVSMSGFPSFIPLICYEIIFSHDIFMSRKRADFILNVTNDAWFGHSSGPYQHLMEARFRAIEEGMPVVRAANTGISSVINSYGDVVRSLPLDTRGTLDAPIPQKIRGRTVYSQFGDWIILLVVCLFWIILRFGTFIVFANK